MTPFFILYMQVKEGALFQANREPALPVIIFN